MRVLSVVRKTNKRRDTTRSEWSGRNVVGNSDLQEEDTLSYVVPAQHTDGLSGVTVNLEVS